MSVAMTKGMLVRLRPDWRPAGMLENIREFEGCIGVVLGHPEPGWPEWDVRWEPSGLRYAYPEEALEPAKRPLNKVPTCPLCMKNDRVRVLPKVAVFCDRCDAAI